jgi:hypothetical protein
VILSHYHWEVPSNPKAWYFVEKGSPNDPKYSIIKNFVGLYCAPSQWEVMIYNIIHYNNIKKSAAYEAAKTFVYFLQLMKHRGINANTRLCCQKCNPGFSSLGWVVLGEDSTKSIRASMTHILLITFRVLLSFAVCVS